MFSTSFFTTKTMNNTNYHRLYEKDRGVIRRMNKEGKTQNEKAHYEYNQLALKYHQIIKFQSLLGQNPTDDP